MAAATSTNVKGEVEVDECMEGIQTGTDEFGIADPEGEEPVRWDFVDVDESQPGQMEIHVEFNNGMWWHMPYYLSDGILAQWKNGHQQVSFVWDWENSRKGSFVLGGVATSINRYIMDFNKMQQTNIDNNRTRRIKVVSVIRGSMWPHAPSNCAISHHCYDDVAAEQIC